MLPVRAHLPSRAVQAHALKNCLAIVCAVNRLLEPELCETAQRRLSRSQHAVRRMIALIEADLAPAEAPAACQVDLASVAQILSAVSLRVADLAEARGIELLFRAGPGGIRGDVDGLTEALGNIVLNAIEATSPAGAVVVASQQGDDQGQLWTVRDTGPGITRDALRRAGRPFSSQRPGGSGLGLAVARDIVERHGGLVHLESAPGSGTLVSIWLPGNAS